MEMEAYALEDQDPLPLNADQVAEVKKAVRKLQEHLAMVTWYLDHEGISQPVAKMILGVIESETADLGKKLSVDTLADERIEKRHAEIRAANMRIHELEAMIGQAQTPESIQPALQVMSKQVNAWWDLEGFGHVREMSFGEYSLKVDFSCHFTGSKPIIEAEGQLTHKERRKIWLGMLEQRGFELLNTDGENYLRDCPASRDTLRALFAQRFGRHQISEFKSHECKAGSKLVGVTVYIYDLAPIMALPIPPENTEEV